MKERKTAAFFFITVFSALLLMAGAVYAGEETVYDITDGSITVTADSPDGSRHKVKQGERAEETVIGPLIISGNKARPISNTIMVVAGEDKKADVVIRDVNIKVSVNKDTSAFKTEGAGDVDIELDGENTVKSERESAGIQKQNAGVLTIKDENSEEGSLTATGADGAGIGGKKTASGNNIIISGGTVTAISNQSGAGIGGGANGSGNDITITGGTVTATGNNGGAGIGGGDNGYGDHITITGGTVTATGNNGGAGIGGGNNGYGDHIMITGGTVTATSRGRVDGGPDNFTESASGAAIGAGYSGSASNIIIRGWATVTAKSQDQANVISSYNSEDLYNTGSITTYYSYISSIIDGKYFFAQRLLLKETGDNTPLKSKVYFRSDPEGTVTNLPSDNDQLYDAGSTISLSALEYDNDKYRFKGLSIPNGTGILTGNQTDGYSVVVGEREEGEDSIVIEARFVRLPHIHSFEISASPSGNTANVMCTVSGCDFGKDENHTVTISADDKPYDGSPVTATLSYDESFPTEGITVSGITYRGTGTTQYSDTRPPSVVGTYEASATVSDGKNTITIFTNFSITEKQKEEKKEEGEKEEEKKENTPDTDNNVEKEPEKKPEKVPVSDPSSSYASPEDNFAPVAPGSSGGTGGNIKKLELDFSNVKGSGVDPSGLRMTAITGSKFTTKAKVKDKDSVHTEGGVKAKFNKKDSTVTITCKNTGKATFNMEDGDSYTVTFTVEKPKPNKNESKISKGTAPVTKTIKDLFGTSITGGKLTILKTKVSGQATLSDNALSVNPAEKDTIKLQYQYLNKKYKMTMKVK